MPVCPPRPRPALGGLWANRPFRRMWAGQTVSLLGSQVTTIALPLTAAMTLNADAVQMGVLAACARLPYLLFGLIAGVWVDRGSRRRIMLACNLGQAATLAIVPLAAAAHQLALPVLYLIAFTAGALAVVADIAGLSLLPMLVPPRDRTTSQGALEVSQSLAQVAGPALAGGLVQALSAPIAILADALSFVFSAVALAGVRVRHERPAAPANGITVRGQVIVGARAVFGEPVLRAVTLCTAAFIFCTNAATAVFVLYLTRDLGLSPSTLGLSLAGGAVGGLAGSVVAARLAARFGVGRMLAVSVMIAGLGSGVVVLAVRPQWLAVALVIGSQAIQWFGSQIYHVLQVPFRYALADEALHGRVNATIRTTVWGLAPVGAFGGGLLGDAVGVRGTLAVSAVGAALAAGWIVLSPVWRLRSVH